MAAGPVRLFPVNLPGTLVEASVLDLSAHGFRAAHRCRELAAGQTVAFEHKRASGRARVMWTSIMGDQFKTLTNRSTE